MAHLTKETRFCDRVWLDRVVIITVDNAMNMIDPDLNPSALAQFSDPKITANSEARASVNFTGLKTLWFNTGSLCNIACVNCYIESSPTADHFTYLTHEDVTIYLDEVELMKKEPIEIGLTGGEPFMNPHIIAICTAILERGHDLLILSNAMRPMRRPRIQKDLLGLQARFEGRLTIRVSLDHYTARHHDELRGAGSFDLSCLGINWLVQNNVRLSLAGRSVWGEEEAQARDGFAALCTMHDWPVNCASPLEMVIFPEMDVNAPVPEITTACWDILSVSPDSMMCAGSRMVVKRKDKAGGLAAGLRVMACTLLWDDPQFDLGRSLVGATSGEHQSVPLNHPHCAKFCVLGGASCSA